MSEERPTVYEVRKNLLDALERRDEDKDEAFVMLANVCGQILNILEQQSIKAHGASVSIFNYSHR